MTTPLLTAPAWESIDLKTRRALLANRGVAVISELGLRGAVELVEDLALRIVEVTPGDTRDAYDAAMVAVQRFRAAFDAYEVDQRARAAARSTPPPTPEADHA